MRVKRTSEVHRHLYHYTTAHPLRAILSSQTLWATHYRHLNDFSEVEHMRPTLEGPLVRFVSEEMRELARRSLKFKRQVRKDGGIPAMAETEAKAQVEVLYEATFGNFGDREPLAEPYVASFCAHTHHDEYEKENGLLSQWRAYGNQGGFALIFDTKGLEDLLQAELNAFRYTAGFIGDVVYDHQTDLVRSEFAELFEALRLHIGQQAGRTDGPRTEDLFLHFFNSVTRFKHRGFREENEVRLVVSPISGSTYRRALQSGVAVDDGTGKRIKPTLKREGGVPYVVMNDVPDKRDLPLVRIIVGPQERQEERAREIRALLGGKRVPVTCSQTPFLPSRNVRP